MIVLLCAFSAGFCGPSDLSREEVKLLHQAFVLYGDRKFDAAEKRLAGLPDSGPNSFQARVLLARIRFHTKKYAEAEKILHEILREDESNPHALMWLGKILLEQDHRHREAAEIFKRILKRDPENFMAHYHLGRCFERQHRMKSALRQYQRALAVEHQLSRMHLHVATLFARLRLDDRARKHYGRARLLAARPLDIARADGTKAPKTEAPGAKAPGSQTAGSRTDDLRAGGPRANRLRTGVPRKNYARPGGAAK